MSVSPREVLRQVAEALPADCRKSIIIVGSLAAGYYFFGSDRQSQVRTKDVDCMLSPHVKAVRTAKAVAERLAAANWQLRAYGGFKPGDSSSPDESLPLVRMHPPRETEWNIELLSAPESGAGPARKFTRLETRLGHFALCSFGYLALVEEKPIATEFGLAIARPEMMALANLLHHPMIGTEQIAGTTDKRCNKDLGRVLALALLAERREEDAVLKWPEEWVRALKNRFSANWRSLAKRSGHGIRALLDSEPDLEEARRIAQDGLLISLNVTPDTMRVTGLRLIQDAIEPLEAMAGS